MEKKKFELGEEMKEVLAKIVDHSMARSLERSFAMVSKEERQGRLRAVMALSVEVTRLREESLFATGLAEGVITDIIEGDWEAALELGLHFTFTTESEDLRAHEAPRWAKFVDIVRAEAALAAKRAKGEESEPS